MERKGKRKGDHIPQKQAEHFSNGSIMALSLLIVKTKEWNWENERGKGEQMEKW